MIERMSNERLAEIVTELQDEDRRAQASGATHGNYGEDFGALVLDLRDARAALVRLGYAEDANRQLEIARERIAEVERERDEWRLAAGAEAEAYDAENERFKKRGGELDALDAEVARLKAECDDGRCPSATAGAALLNVARAAERSADAYTAHQRSGAPGWMESVWALRAAVDEWKGRTG